MGPRAADLQRRALAALQPPLDDAANVQDSVTKFPCVLDLETPGRRADGALVADLPALLRIEGSAIEDQSDLRFGEPARAVERVVGDPAEDSAFRGRAEPLGPVVGRRQSAADIQRYLPFRLLAAGLLLVFGHQLLKASVVRH